MKKISLVVLDAGPLIHLKEVCALHLLRTVKSVIIPPEVHKEIKKHNFNKRDMPQLSVVKLNGRSKDIAKSIQHKYGLGAGESAAIALGKQEKIKLFLTDDLEARSIGKHLGFKVHGTIGIITRAYAMKLITIKETKKILNKLYLDSSLFVTKDLIDWVKKQL